MIYIDRTVSSPLPQLDHSHYHVLVLIMDVILHAFRLHH